MSNYTPHTWIDGSLSTPLNATRLNEVEAGLVAVDNAQANRQPALAPTSVKTVNYTAVAGDLIPVDLNSQSVTVTLPTAPPDKTQVGVQVVTAGTSHSLTVATAGSDVFNKSGGPTSVTFSLVNQGAVFQYKTSAAIWYAVSGYTPLADLDGRYVSGVTNADSTITVGGTTTQPTLAVSSATLAGKADDTAVWHNALLTTKGDLVAASGANIPARVGVGADGQVLTADSTQSTGVKWANATGGGSGTGSAIPLATVTTKGDLVVATASATVTRLGVGTNNQVLTADSTQTSGVKWANATGGGSGSGTSVTVLEAADAVPGGLADGTVVLRKRAASITETWTGTNGAVWPAVDTNSFPVWTTVANGGTVDIQSNAGRVLSSATNGNFTYAYRPGLHNADLTVAVTVSTTASTHEPQIRFRQHAIDWSYAFVLRPNANQVVFRYINGATVTNLATASFTFSATTYSLRLRWDGTGFWAKVWTGSEPSSWTVTATDANNSVSGSIVFGVGSLGSAQTATFDGLSVVDLS